MATPLAIMMILVPNMRLLKRFLRLRRKKTAMVTKMMMKKVMMILTRNLN
jgi:hypothetical protein